jgi:hypothetical protein
MDHIPPQSDTPDKSGQSPGHTVSPVRREDRTILSYRNSGPLAYTGDSGRLYAEEVANARRIVALWNAAHDMGLTTEAVEAGAIQGLLAAVRFYANPAHWNEDDQCASERTTDAETGEFLSELIDTGNVARAALAKGGLSL